MSRGARDYRAGKEYPDEEGTLYLLCFRNLDGSKAHFGHAGHYVGWAKDLEHRVGEYAGGTGANLTIKIHELGLVFEVVRTRPGTKKDEYRIKAVGGQSRYCPLCTDKPLNGVWVVAQ